MAADITGYCSGDVTMYKCLLSLSHECDSASSETEWYPAIPKYVSDWYQDLLCVWLLETKVYVHFI